MVWLVDGLVCLRVTSILAKGVKLLNRQPNFCHGSAPPDADYKVVSPTIRHPTRRLVYCRRRQPRFGPRCNDPDAHAVAKPVCSSGFRGLSSGIVRMGNSGGPLEKTAAGAAKRGTSNPELLLQRVLP